MKSALYLTPKLPYPPCSGGQVVSWNLARCLRENDFEIDLVTLVQDGRLIDRHCESLKEVFRSVSAVRRNARRQYPLTLVGAIARGTSYFVDKFSSRQVRLEIDRRLSLQPYDVSLVESAYMAANIGPLVAQHGRSGPLVLRLQNIEHEIFERLAKHERNPIFRYLLKRESRLFKRFERQVFESVDDVLAISSRDAARAARLARRPVGVLRAHIDCDVYRPDDAADVERQSVVCFGDLSWRPNRNGLLWLHRAVWPKVLERFPDARLYVVGRNPPARVRNLASENTYIEGFVEDDVDYFRRARLLLVPLLEGSGVRVKILTALSMGKEVLSTHVGAEGIDYDGIVRKEDSSDWVEHIATAFSTEALIDREAVAYVRQQHHWARPFRVERTDLLVDRGDGVLWRSV